MDTEEHIEIQKAIRAGKPETDEGPYYHESWWESYKGSVKGKLGGAVIGAVVGAAIGVVAALAIPAIAGVALTGATFGLTVAAFAAGGMMYGEHEFSEVGKVTGAVAAAHEKSEQRMKAFEAGKFAELKGEIQDIKAMLGGKKQNAEAALQSSQIAATAAAEQNPSYRTQHCDEHCPPEEKKPIFWKVAAIGLVVGAAAGAILATGGLAAPVVELFAGAHLSGGAVLAASMVTLGLFGASFGINRDMFRQVFDKTDRLFKGLTGKSNGVSHAVAPEPVQMADKPIEKQPNTAVTTVVYDNSPVEYPKSDTYHRDKVLASAKQALLSMDHTKAIPH